MEVCGTPPPHIPGVYRWSLPPTSRGVPMTALSPAPRHRPDHENKVKQLFLTVDQGNGSKRDQQSLLLKVAVTTFPRQKQGGKQSFLRNLLKSGGKIGHFSQKV